MNLKEARNNLHVFLTAWPVEKVFNMTLSQYVNTKDKKTFCYGVETQTRLLGSIHGRPGSIKFGIYKRIDPNQQPKLYDNDKEYSWKKSYHSLTQDEAFIKVKAAVQATVTAAVNGQFDQVDDIDLHYMFKWKIAFLYSNERLVPIFKREVLMKIANHYGLPADIHTPISSIQEVLIAHKPAELDVYNFMVKLYGQFGHAREIPKAPKRPPGNTKGRLWRRKASEGKGTGTQTRIITKHIYTIEQRHNELQEALKQDLIEKYGQDRVKAEENYIDITVNHDDHIALYEIKMGSYPSECIRQALGQLLLYSFGLGESKAKKHYIVGAFPPNDSDKAFIQFLRNQLKVHLEYLQFENA